MSTDPSDVLLRRASMLLEQRRYEDAQAELRRLLADDPQHVYAHALLSLALSSDDRIGNKARSPEHRQQLMTATNHAELAIAADPNDAIGFYALATSYLRRGDYSAAIGAGRSAIALDPYDADNYRVVAAALWQSRKFTEALEVSESGLRVDPEHGGCMNLRSLSLERLGRSGDAIDAARAQLSREPNDATAHAVVGFAHLNRGEPKQAQAAFREALRLDPVNEFARGGMIEAINSGNFFYRTLYRYFVWIGRLDQRMAFAVMIGLYFLVNGLNQVGRQYPLIKPFVMPMILLYLVFAISTWIASPLMNTLLRFHPFGRHLLNSNERWTSNLIAALFVLAAITLVGFSASQGVVAGMIMAIYWLILAVLVVATMRMPSPQTKILIGLASFFVALLPCLGDVQYFIYGCLAIQLGSHVLAARQLRF
jgi:tetratricopeptide (TPR) repeat protein